MKRVLSMCLPACTVVLAHHSLSVDFDRTKPVEFTAIVVQVSLLNPHGRFIADVGCARWEFELASVNALVKQGWTSGTLREGDRVSVSAFLDKKGARRAYLQFVTLPNGTRLGNIDGWEMQASKSGKETDASPR